MTSTTGRRSARTRRRGSRLRRLAITLVALLVILVVLDRGGDLVAERLAASNLQSSQHLAKRPDVAIDGVPFLTQFAQRDYDHITVDADALPVADRSLIISHLHVDLYRLKVSRDFATFHVATATARATITYAQLSKRIGVDVQYAGGHRIRASKSFELPVVGTIRPAITVRPELVNGSLAFGASSIDGAGDNLGAVSGALSKIFDLSVPLNGLPFQIKVSSLDVDSSGLHASFVGADLTFTKNG